jgi:hypothetical protein
MQYGPISASEAISAFRSTIAVGWMAILVPPPLR